MHNRGYSYSCKTIFAIGFLTIIWSILQILFRYSTPLLPEDVQFTGITVNTLSKENPQLLKWLGLVMRAWGAFVFSTGIFTVYLAKFGLGRKQRWAFEALALGGIPMFTLFIIGNVILRSQFLIPIGLIFILFCTSLMLIWKSFHDETHPKSRPSKTNSA